MDVNVSVSAEEPARSRMVVMLLDSYGKAFLLLVFDVENHRTIALALPYTCIALTRANKPSGFVL